jgi:hypothetical protein
LQAGPAGGGAGTTEPRGAGEGRIFASCATGAGAAEEAHAMA